jgi:hypothetical protein
MLLDRIMATLLPLEAYIRSLEEFDPAKTGRIPKQVMCGVMGKYIEVSAEMEHVFDLFVDEKGLDIDYPRLLRFLWGVVNSYNKTDGVDHKIQKV